MSLDKTIAHFETLKKALEQTADALRQHAVDMIAAHNVAASRQELHDAFAQRSARMYSEMQAAMAFASWASGASS